MCKYLDVISWKEHRAEANKLYVWIQFAYESNMLDCSLTSVFTIIYMHSSQA